MTEKSKRKFNTRRRLLVRLMLGIGIFAALMSAAIYALQPKGTQIVFIAPDDNGIDNIWLADLNDPENPHQITSGTPIASFVMAQNNNVIVYEQKNPDLRWLETWQLDLETGEHKRILDCGTLYYCAFFSLQPDGKWLSYVVHLFEEEVYQQYIYNLETTENRLIFSRESVNSGYQGAAQWAADGTRLIARIDWGQYAIYSPEEERIIDILSIAGTYMPPLFSDDGLYYARSADGYYRSPTSLEVYQSDSRQRIVLPIEDHRGNSELIRSVAAVWLPNNEELLVSDFWQTDDECCLIELNLYNITTGEKSTLLKTHNVVSGFHVEPNYDGSQLLLHVFSREVFDHQSILYDIDKRKEIFMPLLMDYPQWVNGGH